MKKLFSLVVLVALLSCSCTTLIRTSETADVNSKLFSLTVAELDVQPTKVSKTYSWGWSPFRMVSVDREIQNLTADLLKEYDADVLVEPNHIVKRGGFLQGGSVTVIGFPAKIKNFHNMTPEEVKGLGCQGNCDKDKKMKKHHKKFIGIGR